MVKEEDKTRSTGDEKKKEKTQILQRSEIQFEVGKKKTVFFGDTDPKEKVKENGVKGHPAIETKTRVVERYQNRPQGAKEKEEEGEERGVVGDNTTEIEEDPGEKKTKLVYIFRDINI